MVCGRDYRFPNPPPSTDPLGRLLLMYPSDEGETVYVDGVQDAALRSQLASFLSALGLAAPAKEVDGEKTPQAFRCSRGGGGVLRCVALLMDERGMVNPPPLDREAAFDTAKKASTAYGTHSSISTQSISNILYLVLQQYLGDIVQVLVLSMRSIRTTFPLALFSWRANS